MGLDYLPDIEKSLEINQSACSWTSRAISILRDRLKVNIKLHDPDNVIHSGEIFLFNHFARFETVIAHYLVHKETGAYCRSVASAEFFAEDNRFSRYIRGLGAVPNNHPKLLPFLAAEILRGRKVIIFPEGGMVKDRLVVDTNGEYSVYSRSAKQRRKQHSGAAVLSLMLDAFKTGILEIDRSGDRATLERWAQSIGLGSVDALLEAVHRPTNLIPSNITFYPIRTGQNLMNRAVELFGARIPSQFSEEMLIEGNILLKDTDMDICLGDPVRPVEKWSFLHRMAFARFVREKKSLDEMFNRSPAKDAPLTRIARKFVIGTVARHIEPVRDAYTREMYANVTVNLGHLSALLIRQLIDLGRNEIDRTAFHRMLYLAVKTLQKVPSVRRHRGLRNPSSYTRLLTDDCTELDEQLATAQQLGLIHRDEKVYAFLPSLQRKHELDRIRIENPLAVAANEAAPVAAAVQAVHVALATVDTVTEREWAMMRFDDMVVRHLWDQEQFSRSQYRAINEEETATESGAPFLLLPKNDNGLGIVLVHGFLASPAEVRGLGEKLADAGHTVLGVRLAGHGTSPWDLREQSWQDWLDSVRRGYDIMSVLSPRIGLVGFSTGGTLCLLLAADRPAKLACAVAVAPALKFMNRNMVFVPLVHGANRITKWLPSYEGVKPFQTHSSEHPHINYRHMPFRGLFELRRVVDEMQSRLGDINCPVAIYQGNKDPVVDPKGADIIFERLGSERKWLHRIASKRHGIVNENIDGTHEKIVKFLATITTETATA